VYVFVSVKWRFRRSAKRADVLQTFDFIDAYLSMLLEAAVTIAPILVIYSYCTVTTPVHVEV